MIGIGWLNCFLILPLITLWGNLSQFCQHTLFWRHSQQFEESQFCKRWHGEIDKCWIISNVFPFLVFIAELQQSLHNCWPLLSIFISLWPDVVSPLTLQDSGDKKHWASQQRQNAELCPHIASHETRGGIHPLRGGVYFMLLKVLWLMSTEGETWLYVLNDKSLTDPRLSEKILKISVQFAGGHSNLRSTKRSLS